jgi:hypothetical protein
MNNATSGARVARVVLIIIYIYMCILYILLARVVLDSMLLLL